VKGLANRVVEYIRGKGIGAETIRYATAGALTTVINYGLFELLWNVIGLGLRISNIASISISILFAYAANKLVVFRKRSDTRFDLVLEFAKFIGSRLFTMALEVVAVEVFVGVLGQNARLGKLAAQALVIVTNYLLSKMMVFRAKR